MTDIDDDNPDLEGLSEAELDRVLASEIRQLDEWLGRLPRKDLIRWKISVVLRTCKSWRSVLKEFDLDLARQHLKERQRRLLALRIERQTGRVVGNA